MNFAIMYNLPAVYYIMAPGSKGTTWIFSHCICGGEPSGGKVSILPSPPPPLPLPSLAEPFSAAWRKVKFGN
jgi:hypothetical protein